MSTGNWTGPDRDHDSWESRAWEQHPVGDREGNGYKTAEASGAPETAADIVDDLYASIRWNPPTPPAAYEVIWPGGEVYANRHQQTRLSEAEAKATAPRIGGTWRRVTVTEAPKEA